MDDRLKNSQVNTRSVSRTGSLLGSFKMGDSVLGTGKNRKIRNLELKNLQLVDKDAYRKQEECQVCFITFGKLNRQHHCRVCANAVCSDCSASCINKERCGLGYVEPAMCVSTAAPTRAWRGRCSKTTYSSSSRASPSSTRRTS